jgi:membrane protein DedA with SNARE-associated domain
MSDRRRLALYLVPIVGVMVAGQVGRALWPTLLDAAPWTLLALTSAVTRLLLVQPVVPAVVFFAIAITRICILGPIYYGFGRDYGDAAIRWSEERFGTSTTTIQRIERWFRKFARVLVVCWWSIFVCLLAGATGMRARVFLPLIVLGAVLRVSAIYFIGDWFSGPLTAIAEFIGRYALFLTPVTIGITALQVWYAHRRRRTALLGSLTVGAIADLDGLEADFAGVEAEVAAEATVTAPPDPD